MPASFSWVDHRLVRQNLLSRCPHRALALYLFLVTVADAQGLSYFSDPAIGRQLNLTGQELAQARQQLVAADLIAFQSPLYQVLSLDSAPPPAPAESRSGQLRSWARFCAACSRREGLRDHLSHLLPNPPALR